MRSRSRRAICVQLLGSRRQGSTPYRHYEPVFSLSSCLVHPNRLLLLQAYDQRLDLEGKLTGLPIRPARTIAQRFKTAVVVAIDKLVARLSRDAVLGTAPPSSHRPAVWR